MEVTAIIPVFNEEKTIQKVIDSLKKSNLFRQLIVIDDGSRDQTSNILKKMEGIDLVENSINKGKSYSVAKGVKRTKFPIVCLLDADYHGYHRDDLSRLVGPLKEKASDITIRRASTPFLTFLSGCRCYYTRDLVTYQSSLEKASGYGLEVFLNMKVHKKDHRKKYITFYKSSHIEKYQRYSLFRAIILYRNIAVEVLKQYFANLRD